jgi:branched-chain amino acid transport system permease protein
MVQRGRRLVLQYVIAGLVLGGIYAISAAGLVVTYLSSGILNFSFGALAYFIARFYYYLHSQQNWGIAPAALVSVALAGPLLGVGLYWVLFRHLRLSSTLIKIVATLGLSVAIPPLAAVLFGNQPIQQAPGLAPEPVRVFHVVGVPVTLDQLIVYGCVIVVMVAGFVTLRYTDVGLQVRAMVDSPAMTWLSGTNPGIISAVVWAVSVFLAGLAGVLSAPAIGLGPTDFTLLMASAFAAVIAAKFRILSVSVIVGLLMGIAGSVVLYALPPGSSISGAVIPSIPFVVMAIFLVYNVAQRGRLNELEGVGGALDAAIAVRSTEIANDRQHAHISGRLSVGPPLIGFAIVAILPLVLHGFWTSLLASGVAYGIVFLSFTLLVGEGGMVWLCVATFAGVGAVTAAQLATIEGWPMLAAVLGGGLLTAAIGVVIGFLTIRLGNLYVALVTLTFGLLMDNLVFSANRFTVEGLGVNFHRPSFAQGDLAFTYLELAIFCVAALFVFNLRRSTTGMSLTAVRSSETGSKTIGVSVVRMKVIVAGLASFIAGVGGALVSANLGVALPANYATLIGVVWLAVLVTQGIRSNMAALFAGLLSTLFPGLVLLYLPASYGQAPPILFGLGAVFIAKNPDGVLAVQARQLRDLTYRVRGSRLWSRQTPAPLESTAPAEKAQVGAGTSQ